MATAIRARISATANRIADRRHRPESDCADGVDNDCDGATDCDDADCAADPACQQTGCDNDGVCEPDEDCENCPNDCDSKTNGPPSGRYCCGNGVLEGPEGDGRCDGT